MMFAVDCEGDRKLTRKFKDNLKLGEWLISINNLKELIFFGLLKKLRLKIF